jgi:hypothetical protein
LPAKQYKKRPKVCKNSPAVIVSNSSTNPDHLKNYQGEIMLFPTVSGSNLLREKLTLPQDLKGSLNLVFVPFYQWQQAEVDSWGPLAGQLEAQHPGLLYYELPIIQSRNALSRMFINEGMRAGIPNAKSRERTITLYLDKKSFRGALQMEDEDHIFVLLVGQNGEIIFQTRGVYSPESGEQLEFAVQQKLPVV